MTRRECEMADFGEKPDTIDYKKMYEARYPLLRKAYERSRISENQDYQRFVSDNDWWLQDYALFMAVKDRFGGEPWTKWAEDIRLRWGNALDYYRRSCILILSFRNICSTCFICSG